MDENKKPVKRADGIRQTRGPVRLKASASRAPKHHEPQLEHMPEPVRHVREQYEEMPEERTIREPHVKGSFFDRAKRISRKDSHTIHDRYFRKEMAHGSFLKNRNLVALISGVGFTLFVAILLSTVFARVTVTLKPVVESMQIENTQVSFNASIDDVNAASRTIPAEFLLFNASVSEDFDATGNDFVNQKAGGRVRIFNAFGTAPQSLVASTRFTSESGVLFRLSKGVVIPGAKKDASGALVPQSVEAELVADKAGEGSNMGGEVKLHIPGFTGTPKYQGFYAVASNGFSGGSVGQGRVVTRDDLAKAQQQLSKKVFDDLKQSMVQKIPANFRYVDSLSEIAIASITAPKEKTRADRFTVEVKAVAHVFVFRDSDVTKLMNQLLLNGDTTKVLIDSSADFHYQIKNANYDKKIADVVMSGTIKNKKVVLPEDIAGLSAGKKEGSLIDVLKQRRDISTFRVSFFPPWIFSAPSDPGKINVIIEDPGSGGGNK